MKVFINNRSLYLVVIFLTSALSILAEPKALTWKEGEREHLIYLSQDYIAEIDPPKSENKERNIRIIPISDTKLKSALAKGNLPVSVCGTVALQLLRGFSWQHGIDHFASRSSRHRISEKARRIYQPSLRTSLNLHNQS